MHFAIRHPEGIIGNSAELRRRDRGVTKGSSSERVFTFISLAGKDRSEGQQDGLLQQIHQIL